MPTTHRLVIPMVPALDPSRQGSDLGDVGTVPAVRVQLGAVKNSIVVAGLIDTGAELSMLSDTIAGRLHEVSGLQSLGSLPLATNFSSVTAQLYQLDMRILGPEPNTEMAFESVPVAVGPMAYPPLLLGRRGLLERLRIDLDFPKRQLTISLPRTSSAKYPALAEMCPSFPSILDTFESGHITQAVMMLAWEIERLADRLSAVSPRQDGDAVARGRRTTLREKLLPFGDLHAEPTFLSAVHRFVEARNRAAHGSAADWHGLRIDTTEILVAAEEIVGRISGHTLHRPGGTREP